MKVPIYNSLEQIYSNPLILKEFKRRLEENVSKFLKIINSDKFDFAVRSPGRVNLIGEHIDYSGYAVLPMAIEYDTWIFVKICSDIEDKTKITLYNSQSKYKSIIVENADMNMMIDKSTHLWSNYFFAGYKGTLEYLQITKPQSFIAYIDGVIPIGSGLSSSSALVCAASLATMHANNANIPLNEVATLCAKSEHYIGIESGGMDQAISLLASRGTAKLIEFDPLKTYDVYLPKDAIFVIANSLTESHKYVTANTCYNMRVVECRLAAVVLAYSLSLDWKKVRKLIDVQKLTNFNFDELIISIKKHLHESSYSILEISNLLGIDKQEIIDKYIGHEIKNEHFELFKRAYHVYSESQRVYKFQSICQNNMNNYNILEELGILMNESQYSCKNFFDCSCPELDILTSICRNSGALGSRLTGAGWGGCTISLIHKKDLDSFLCKVIQNYYQNYLKLNIDNMNYSNILFATQPGSGSLIYIPS